jgi:hypothetical protein
MNGISAAAVHTRACSRRSSAPRSAKVASAASVVALNLHNLRPARPAVGASGPKTGIANCTSALCRVAPAGLN